jgi:hypothetical protein
VKTKHKENLFFLALLSGSTCFLCGRYVVTKSRVIRLYINIREKGRKGTRRREEGNEEKGGREKGRKR